MEDISLDYFREKVNSGARISLDFSRGRSQKNHSRRGSRGYKSPVKSQGYHYSS